MITFAFIASVSNAVRDANAKTNKALGLPVHSGSGRLAVVGGGPSIRHHIEELQTWVGTVWAVNGTINWCLDHGIDAYFYTIDAQPVRNWVYPLNRIKRAVLAIDCDPSLFERLRDAEVTTLSPSDGGPTSANSADFMAIESGYQGGVTFFGCESSFEETSHAFESSEITDWIVVRVGGADFYTKPEFLEQAKVMSEVIRAFPDFYTDRSGGLLSAMVEHGMDYELMAVSQSTANKLKSRAGAMNLVA